jgi:hypothetical protein
MNAAVGAALTHSQLPLRAENAISREYARVWSNHPDRRAEPITVPEWEGLWRTRRKFDIFVRDEGEFAAGQVGRTIIKGVDKSQSGTVGNVAPQEYRLLVHLLRNNRVPGTRDVADLAEHCLGGLSQEAIALLREPSGGDSEGTYYQSIAARCRASAARLTNVLRPSIRLVVETRRSGAWDISGQFTFCVIERHR